MSTDHKRHISFSEFLSSLSVLFSESSVLLIDDLHDLQVTTSGLIELLWSSLFDE